MLWKRHDLAVKSGLAARQPPAGSQILQARDWLNIAVAAGEVEPFDWDQIDQLFGALLGIRLEFRGSFCSGGSYPEWWYPPGG